MIEHENPHIPAAFAGVQHRPYPLGLTAIQSFALPVVKWLLGGQRGAGKSYVLAHAIMQLAVENPGEEWSLFDHNIVNGFGLHQGSKSIVRICQKLSETDYKQYKWRFTQTTMSLRCEGLKPSASSV